MNDLVSIIIPAFNAEKTILESVASLLKQTHRNLQIIIIDDCSIDTTLDKCSNIFDSRVQIVRNKKNIGIAGSLNRGINMAEGKFIGRMDADDISFSDRIESQLKFIKQNSFDLIGGQVNVFGKIINPSFVYPYTAKSVIYYSLIANPISHPTVLGTSEFFKSSNYSESISYLGFEDYELWVRALSNGFSISNLNKPILSYRLSKAQVSNNRKRDYNSRYKSFKNEVALSLTDKIDNSLIYNYLKLLESGNFNQVDNLLTSLGENMDIKGMKLFNQLKTSLLSELGLEIPFINKLKFFM